MRLVNALHPEQPKPALSGFTPAPRLPGFEYEELRADWYLSREELDAIDAARRRVH